MEQTRLVERRKDTLLLKVILVCCVGRNIYTGLALPPFSGRSESRLYTRRYPQIAWFSCTVFCIHLFYRLYLMQQYLICSLRASPSHFVHAYLPVNQTKYSDATTSGSHLHTRSLASHNLNKRARHSKRKPQDLRRMYKDSAYNILNKHYEPTHSFCLGT
jgi:hypothetical protein